MSSEETRKPRSMKNLSVVCHAGPKSSKAPRPRPSRFQRNSFKPLETRVDSLNSGARVAPTAAAGAGPAVRGRLSEGTERERPRPAPAPTPTPIPNFFRKLIGLIRRRSRARWDARRLTRTGGCSARLDLPFDWPAGLNFHAPTKHRAIFNRQSLGAQITGNIGCAPELNLFATEDLSINTPAHNHFARRDVRLDFAMRADRHAAGVAQV